jgi:hypothetical protein
MKSKKALWYVLLALAAGCGPIFSLHPLFTEENLTFDERLLGSWVDDVNKPGQSWEFSRLGPVDPNTLEEEFKGVEERLYRLTVQDDEKGKGIFIACLGKLGDRLFLDILPARFPSGQQDLKKAELIYNVFFFLPVHTFAKVEIVNNQLKISLTDDDKFNDLMKAEPNAIKHELFDSRLVLTAPPKDLQAFVTKHANDKRLFADETVLKRKSSK